VRVHPGLRLRRSPIPHRGSHGGKVKAAVKAAEDSSFWAGALLTGSVAQIGRGPEFPYPRTDLSCDFRDICAEGDEAVQDGDTNLELCGLTVEAACGKALPQELDAVHPIVGKTVHWRVL
jgi:hypothetical protein